MSRQQLLFRPPDHRLSCPLLLLLLVSVVETYLAVTDNVKSWQAGNGDVVLFCESDSKFFNRTNRLALVHCGEAECGEYFSLSCVLPDTGLTSFCSESGLEEPLNAVTTKDFIYDKLLLPSVLAGRYYTCSRGMIWNGGEGPGRLAVCWNREWNNITDSCVIDPTVPRDCSELAARGFNTSDVYLTRPDGVSQLVTEVWCDLDDQQEGAWMTVLKVDTNSQLPDQYKDSMYFYGFGSPDDTTFFIGFHHLANLTLGSDSSRPLVLQVLLTTSDGGEYHVTYDNVTFGEAPQRRLLSLGSVHGNAGDGLRGAEGKSVQSGQNSFWWLSQERTSNLFALSWFPFYGEGKDLAKVVVRVRPQEYDASVACPPLGVSVEAWRDPPVHLTGHVPDSRAPGVTVNITCVKKMYGFDMSGEVRRKTEFLICEEQANGGPAWNSSFSPCQLLCPAEFEPFPEFDVCLHQEPPEQSSYGATSSALRCAGEEGATLATAYDIPYDQLSTDPNPAMTIHRVVGDNIVPSLPDTMTCHEEDHHCQIDDSHRCVGVINSENYTLLDCGASDYGILCQLPPECPEGFRDHRGLCYAVVSSVSNLVEGQLKCEERGASLAIPQTLEDLKFFAWLVRQHAANSGMTSSSGAASDPWQAMLGLNDMLGDFTVDGLFLPDGELLDLANTTNHTLYDYWRVLEVPADEDTFPSLLPVTFLSNSATYAICMLFGPTGCWTEPPSLAANMTRVWEDGAKDYFTTISYKCHRGYFMAGDTKWAEENITCVGILGGWLPGHLFDCIRVEVCDGEVPPAHDLMNSTSDEDFRFLDGSLTYTCPPGMATTEGHVNQTVICYENPDGDGYSFQPFQVDPCNVCQEEPSVGNATTSWNDTQVWMVNDTLSVACIPHHLLDGEPDGELLCTPLGWEERYCYEGCTEAPPTPGANMTQGEGDYSVGSILQYTCDSGYFVPPLQLGEMARSMVEVSCGMDHNWTYVGPLECYRLCHGDPPVAMDNITSTWDCFSRVVGTQVNMSCPTNHVFPDLNDTVTITCEEDEEWTPVYASFLICRQLCPWSKSSEIPVNATILHDPTPYWLESEILYGCPDGFESLLGSTTATETCLDDGWILSEPGFGCFAACQENPPSVPPPGNTTWNGTTRLVGTQVNLTCPMNHTFGDFNTSLSLTCEKDGYWTYVDPDILLCRIECPEEPPSAPANSTLEDAVPPYWVTSNVTYECEEGLGLPWGGTVTVLTCEEDGWTAFPTGLKCLAACSPPPQPRGLGKYNHTGPTLWGTVVEYTCPYGFDVEEKDEEDEGPMLLSTTCEDGSWSLTDIPNCYDPTSTATPAPPTMPPTDVFTQRYVNTTTKHYGDLQDLMTAYNITDNRQIVAGPLGFGNAVQLDKSRKQCLIIQDTEDTKDNTYDPSLATEGFSLSLWIKSEYTEQEFFDAKFYDKYLKECFVSTGGDTMGHKGVTIYQQGIFLIAEVSTGSQYWQVMVPGAVPHDKWTNVGVRWAATVGLELAVNSDIKSMMKHPRTTTASTDTPVLETTIGCCRNHDSETQSLFLYDGFSDVEVDEYSLWDRYLGGNDTIYFLGGYVGEPAYFTPDIFKSLLQSTDLEKPEQRAMAVEVLKGYMTHIEAQEKGDEDYEEYAEGEEEEAVDAQNPNTTAADGAAAASKSQQFQDLVSITMQLSQNSGLEDVQTAEDTRRSLDILFMAGKLLKPKHRKDWKKLAEQEDGISAMEFASHLEKFILNSGLAHARSDRPSPRIAAAYDGVCVQLNVITVKDLVGPSEDFATPIQLESDANEEAWTKCNDHVEIPRDMFTDERCSDRKAVIASFIYTTLHKIQAHPLPVTAGKLNPKVENFIDSKVASFRVAVTPVMRASGKVDPAMPPCNPNPLKSKLKSNFHHLSTMQTSRRHLLFHGNLTTSKLEARRCAWYNPKNGQHGQWEGEQCRVWQSFEGGTKCMCRKQGMYAVVAEMVEPMVVPEEPEWLVVVRYVLYGLSAACLLFFIFVVAFAGDLKEQFHLMGLCLAAYLLAGSIFMVVSDAEEVRTDRHACTAIGTLLHFCYLAAGAWMAMIGHASFRCVTSGIVGGRMKQYGYLSAGMPLVSVGCTYTFFLYDLGNDPRCFISWYDSPKEVFFAPQIIFCGVALFCALVIFFNLHTAAFRNKPSMEDYRSFSLGASLLIVYFSLTWTIAVVTYIDFELDVDFYPVFQILNGLSGVMLLVCLGACSSRFRMVLAGQAKLKLRNSSNRSDGGGGDGGRDTGVLIPPPAASPRRFAPSPRRVAPSPIPSTAPTSLSPLPSRPPSSNTLEVPGVRPRSTASLI